MAEEPSPKANPQPFSGPTISLPNPSATRRASRSTATTRPEAYRPRPETVAAQQYYDFFVASQNLHRHSRWENGWKTHDRYLSRARIRAHLRGKEIYGCWGDLWTNWFAIDVDYHGGDPNRSSRVLEILKELRDFLPAVRWIYFLNRDGISGLHIVGLLPAPRLLEDVRKDVLKVLVYLGDEQGVDLANLEIYPATNHNFRLPYASDRITVTDEWLNLPGEVNLKPNLVKFMAYVRDRDRQAVPLDKVIEYIKANIQVKPPKQQRSQNKRKRTGGNGMGKIVPLKGRHLTFLTGVVLGTETMPDDTIGCWAAPALAPPDAGRWPGCRRSAGKDRGVLRDDPRPGFFRQAYRQHRRTSADRMPIPPPHRGRQLVSAEADESTDHFRHGQSQVPAARLRLCRPFDLGRAEGRKRFRSTSATWISA